jgi:uncharacterized protein YqjF (DUF2071 family)
LADTPQSQLDRILANTAHRPYPLPAGKWIMRQRWNDLLFAHWPMPAAAISAQLPPELAVDTFDDQGWLGVVPFWMDRVHHHLPFASQDVTLTVPTATRFAELNLRTYVRSRRTGRRGVYFFALECASPLAVTGARVLFHLPYFLAAMQYEQDGARMDYRSRRQLTGRSVQVELTYQPTGPASAPAQPGSLAHFLTERYCLFTQAGGRILRGDIHHEPWPLQPAEAKWRSNGLAAAHGFTLPEIAPVLHYSRELQVFVWPLTAEQDGLRS